GVRGGGGRWGGRVRGGRRAAASRPGAARLGPRVVTERRLLLVAAVLAAMVRADLLVRRETISVDGVQYIAAARQLRAGDWGRALRSFYPPGYPLALAGATSLVGDPERAGLLVSAVAGGAGGWPRAAPGGRGVSC